MTIAPRPALEVADTGRLRKALGTFATGVTVMTIGGVRPHGMTANAFTSVSLEPPLVLVCVDHSAIMYQGLATTKHFGVSVLTARQEAIARHFADRRRPLGTAQFNSVDWQPGRLTGVPLIGGAIARLECEIWRHHDAGDHTIFLGRLLAIESQEDEEALLFFGGGFRRLSPDPSEVAT